MGDHIDITIIVGDIIPDSIIVIIYNNYVIYADVECAVLCACTMIMEENNIYNHEIILEY